MGTATLPMMRATNSRFTYSPIKVIDVIVLVDFGKGFYCPEVDYHALRVSIGDDGLGGQVNLDYSLGYLPQLLKILLKNSENEISYVIRQRNITYVSCQRLS